MICPHAEEIKRVERDGNQETMQTTTAQKKERIKDTYAKNSKATLKQQLYDAYVRFFRWATDRLQGRDGIVCLVSNNSFLDSFAFDGFRRRLLEEFTQIYHIDLHGNVRKNPKLSGTTHNVFGIQVGVGITVAVRSRSSTKSAVYYYRVPEIWKRAEKLAYLVDKDNITNIQWQELEPDSKYNWLTTHLHPEFNKFFPIGTKEGKASRTQNPEALFKFYFPGVFTGRDSVVYEMPSRILCSGVEQESMETSCG
jgi:predicted helicase